MHPAWIAAAALFFAAAAFAQNPREDVEKSRVTMPAVQQVIVPGLLMSHAAIPSRYHAALGWAQAVTLSTTQTGTARVEMDSMVLLEQNPSTGLITPAPGAQLSFDQPLAFGSQGELYNRVCSDGSFRNECWFANGTTTIPSTASGGVVTIDVASIPTKVPHWWTPRANATPGALYWLQATFRVTGGAAIQFGVDYWLDTCSSQAQCAPFSPYDNATCVTANPCEAWVSNWIGDTGGQFVTVLFPLNMPAPVVQAGHFGNAFEY